MTAKSSNIDSLVVTLSIVKFVPKNATFKNIAESKGCTMFEGEVSLQLKEHSLDYQKIREYKEQKDVGE